MQIINMKLSEIHPYDEREVITERVRDKMSASRKKGKWVGGRVPMGYRVENKKLTIVEGEARIIQRIFQRFIEVQSPALIARELNKDGIRTNVMENRKRLSTRTSGIGLGKFSE